MRELIRLAFPMVIAYLGINAMNIVDLLAVGRVSATAIGAVGVGIAIYMWGMVFGNCLLQGMDFPIAKAFGEQNPKECFKFFQQGLMLAIVQALPMIFFIYMISDHLSLFGFETEVAREARIFLRIHSWSMISVFGFIAVRQFLQAMGIAVPATYAMIFANIVNALGCYTLVLGHLGFPRLGSEGSAWATFFSRFASLLWILIYLLIWDYKNHKFIFSEKWNVDLKRLKMILKLGFPSAMQGAFEVGAFGLATLLAGRIGTHALAAHQIVLNLASTTFMVPLGIGAAGSVVVGQAVGRKDFKGITSGGWSALKLAVGFMSFTCFMMLLFPDFLLRIYTHDESVIFDAKKILFLAALFQIFDGAQVVGGGVLRGLGNTRTTMIVNLVGHWLVGIPLGALLCFHYNWGLAGLWSGLATGLMVVGLSLVIKWKTSVDSLSLTDR